MEIINVCRICLSTSAVKDICSLKSQKSNKSSSEIMLFCLSIQVENDSKVTTKLCLKCYRKILSFYTFKLLALKNNAYLKSLESHCDLKNEEKLVENIKTEVHSITNSEGDEILLNGDVKLEPLNDEENVLDSSFQSDDELLSEVKRIKYEFIPEEVDTKDNDDTEIKEQEKKSKRESSKDLVCEECGKRVKNLKIHMQVHESEDVSKRLSCSLCNKTFASYKSRLKHRHKKHLLMKKSCPICNKTVKNLRFHTMRVHNPSELRFECDQCGKRFISLPVLKVHKNVHTTDRPYECDKCEKNFRNQTNLLHHKRQEHERKDTFICQHCSKSFFTVRNLDRHMIVHSDVRAYPCTQCDKTFKTSKTLKNHTYTHMKEKTFRCKLCDMSFAHPGYLRAHMVHHTKEKRYPCKYCDTKFLRSDHRKRHEFTAHEKHLITKQ